MWYEIFILKMNLKLLIHTTVSLSDPATWKTNCPARSLAFRTIGLGLLGRFVNTGAYVLRRMLTVTVNTTPAMPTPSLVPIVN